MNSQVGAASPDAIVLAALLEQGQTIHMASLALALGTVVLASQGVNGGPETVVCVIVAPALLAEIYLAIRVGFDARLFRALGESRLTLEALDAGLAASGLLAPEKATRTLQPRFTGALHLFRMQVVCAILLAACLIAATGLRLFGAGG
ncbi:MAG TPA: hypothetical protein PKW21_11640 [Rhabdaerophilum sp.]|nr:hypothetical protein [Rhabdaerophilum sp.]